jgi:glycosyltransferase involved in cell wall biosynthesis
MLAAELLASAVGRGSVLTFHAGIDQVYFPRQKARWAVPAFKLLFALPRAIVCNSDAVKSRIVEYGTKAEKVHSIPAFSRQYLEYSDVTLPDALEAFYARHDRVLFSYLAMRPVYYPAVLLDAFESLAVDRPGVGLVLCGLTGHGEAGVWESVASRVAHLERQGRVLPVGDLTHDQFLSALKRSRAYVRTHVSDGVCSSVLEALALGVPVIASDNGTRPAGVVRYPAADAAALRAALNDVVAAEAQPAEGPKPTQAPVADTVALEVELLCQVARNDAASS